MFARYFYSFLLVFATFSVSVGCNDDFQERAQKQWEQKIVGKKWIEDRPEQEGVVRLPYMIQHVSDSGQENYDLVLFEEHSPGEYTEYTDWSATVTNLEHFESGDTIEHKIDTESETGEKDTFTFFVEDEGVFIRSEEDGEETDYKLILVE